MSPSEENPCILVGAQSNDHSAHLAGVSSRQFFTGAYTFTKVQLLVTEYYRFDVPSNFWDVYNVEAEAMGQTLVYPPEGIPDVDRTKPLIAEPADLDRIAPPDPYTAGRLPWIHQVNKLYLEMTGKLERVYFTSPFSLAANIRGYENLVSDMYARPGFAHQLFKFLCDEVLLPHIEALRTAIAVPDLFMDGRDAWASPPMITLDMMDEYVVAYTQHLRSRLGDQVTTRGNWGDAKSRDPERFFAQKLQCSPGVLSVLDPDLYEVGPDRVKAFAEKNDVAVAAGVDATLLKDGPVEAIVERIKFYIDRLARDERCMVHLNQIPADTPTEHIHAAVAACHTFGQLPIAANLDDVPFNLPRRESFSEFLQAKGETIEM